ncbi:Succinylglutamate desuccinylase/aspartoacylase (plasmid) [Paraburkholderia phenoliruptrix BR3459a]|uniref:Succinylglutamate desuccinylase/aspartoacylase n=3 Tax=Paraburkholderia phenoliruptrix TaxID=252970 RepID=K0E0R2_9BURK|nr:Succinylglutamate desuccinylase/aspartoacylase [Paraburkholderia phenoliruptrix BR3459a]
MKSRVWTTIDFNARGVQSDFARVPYSSDISAYGWIPVPMFCFNGGPGPTALLTAGTHGDEYEGQVALRRLVHDLGKADVRGRVIILPALNQPAVVAGRRTSPLDGGNLNRLFPGDPTGGPTSMIAHYVATELFPMADLVIDVHSGGSSLDHVAMTLARPGQDEKQAEAIRRLIKSFGAPYGAMTKGESGGASTTLYAAAEAQGIPALTTELGSGSTLSSTGLTIAEGGLRRVLRDYGIVPNMDAPEPYPTQLVRYPIASIYSPCAGLFEPFAAPGEVVACGQRAGLVHRLDDALSAPVELTFPSGGIVTFRRFPTLSSTGDALFGLMAPLDVS